jgi:hypothetical protein
MIVVNQPLINGNEAKYLAECIKTGWISSEGPFVRRLEEGIAALVGQRHGIVVANGSVALDIAVKALGIGLGDEVILPTFTIIACAAAIVRAGATPVVVDSNPLTWNIDSMRPFCRRASKASGEISLATIGSATEVPDANSELLAASSTKLEPISHPRKRCRSRSANQIHPTIGGGWGLRRMCS